ncbi:MAG TPA: DUF1269 domain-containing protein [Puia sp.]|jgi:uncharacterized membrane protein|nr:DUF1269 domain-containing protein [Puia sp.]
MTNLIIATFKEEAEAIEASQKLHELESIGDIAIYESVVVRKNADGEAVVLQADTIEGGATLSGMAIGTLIGALAGPVGLVTGMLAGTVTGAVVEADHYGFAEDFVSGAADKLQPGTAAVIAEVEEDDPVFIDSSLTPLGAMLTRSDVDYEYTKHSDEEIDELDDEISAARAKLKSAADKDKDKIRRKITKLKEERKERIDEFKEKVKDAVAEVRTSAKERKIGKLRSKIEKHQQKIADLEKELQAVLEKDKEVMKGAEA